VSGFVHPFSGLDHLLHGFGRSWVHFWSTTDLCLAVVFPAMMVVGHHGNVRVRCLRSRSDSAFGAGLGSCIALSVRARYGPHASLSPCSQCSRLRAWKELPQRRPYQHSAGSSWHWLLHVSGSVSVYSTTDPMASLRRVASVRASPLGVWFFDQPSAHEECRATGLLFAALGLALAFALARVVTELARALRDPVFITFLPVPPAGWRRVLGCWISVIATAASVISSAGSVRAGVCLVVNVGVWASAVISVLDRDSTAESTAICVDIFARIVGRCPNASIPVKVVSSWSLLSQCWQPLQLLPVTPATSDTWSERN